MTTAFYEDLRDNTVSPLIVKYGIAASYISIAQVYTPATGAAVNTETATPCFLARFPIARPKLRNLFREELIERASWTLLISAKELTAAGITPTANDRVVFDGKTYLISGVQQVKPGSVAVLFKVLVEG